MADQSFNFDVGGAFVPQLVRDITEAVTPKSIQKQRALQLALQALAHFQPTISKLPQGEKEKFYAKFFPAYGTYEPPLFRRMFGTKAEPILPLPRGAAELQGGEKIKSPTGRMEILPPGIRAPSQGPWEFPEATDAAEMRELIKEQRRAQTEATNELVAQRKLLKPWQPLTEEQYGRYHGKGWAPGSKEEYKEVHGKNWAPESLEEYRKTHAPYEVDEKKKAKRVATLREEYRIAESQTDREYSRYLDILKRQMGQINRGGGEPIDDLTQLPNYLSKSDWLIEHPEGKQLGRKLDQLRDEIYYLETGEERPWELKPPTRTNPGALLQHILPPVGFPTGPVPFAPTTPVETPKPRTPQVIRYNSRGERIQ